MFERGGVASEAREPHRLAEVELENRHTFEKRPNERPRIRIREAIEHHIRRTFHRVVGDV